MTHQVIFLSELLRPGAADAAPYSIDAREPSLAHSGKPVALTVALRYLAGRRAFKRIRRASPDSHD